ncbi:MAG: hypothetical protein IPK66_07200 [Rhodospirillales bacterium]|nr:hypothetical protein [Rhodospirillales bacterium]
MVGPVGFGAPRRALALLLAVTLLASGCASGRGVQPEGGGAPDATAGAPPTPEEEQMRKDANVFNTTVAEGSLVGAGLGILTGVLIGATTGRVDNMVRYGIVGGVAGGILGGVDGYMVAKQQEAGNNRVRVIQAMTRDVQQDNERLKALVESSSKVLDQSKARLAAINDQVAKNQASRDDLDDARARVEQDRDSLQKTLANLKKRRDNYQQAAMKTGGDTRELDQQIQVLSQQIDQLEQNVVAMNQVLAVSKV